MIAHTHSFSFKGRAPIALELDSEAGPFIFASPMPK